jgi:UDP-N-acetylmuramoylalanine--D-glutamate ligase
MDLQPVRSIRQIEHFRASLRGREVVVLGAGRSGRASVRRLVAAGARVRLADVKSREEMGEAAEEAEALGASVLPGFEHLEQAEGTGLVISSPGIPRDHPALQAARDRGIENFGTLELAWRLCASPMIAVTGTNGKGTTCRLMAGMFEAGGIPHILAGNIGEPLADRLDEAAPDVPAIVEVSSFQLESIVEFRPRLAVFLSLAPDHLDRHSDFDEYRAAKARIFENQQSDDIAVINADDDGVRSLAEPIDARKLRVSLESDGSDAGVREGHFFVRAGERAEGVCPVADLALSGHHHMTNALAAALVAHVAGASVEAIAAGISAYAPPEHHMELVAEIDGVQMINDSKASNPSSAVADLRAMERPFVAIVGGKDKGADFVELGRMLSRRARATILIGEAADRIEAGMEGGTIERAETLGEAVRRAHELSEPGGAVILAPACSSFDMFRNYEHRGQSFREAVAELTRD